MSLLLNSLISINFQQKKTLQLPLETVCIITRKNDKHGERMYLSVGMYRLWDVKKCTLVEFDTFSHVAVAN